MKPNCFIYTSKLVLLESASNVQLAITAVIRLGSFSHTTVGVEQFAPNKSDKHPVDVI
jgi:hypothetical protein